MRWSFIGIQVVGIYLAAAFLVALVMGTFILLYFASIFLQKPSPSFFDGFAILLDSPFGQPLVVVGVVLAFGASIFINRAASRYEAWAHWGAVGLIALSMLPVILTAIPFNDPIGWVIASVYCGACVVFIAAMTIAFIKYGPWGMHRST